MNWGTNYVLLETLRKDKDNRQNYLFTDPVTIITCKQKSELKNCFRQIERYLQKGYYLAGFLAYELGFLLEESLNQYSHNQDYPLIWLGVYNKPQKHADAVNASVDKHYYLSTPVVAKGFAQYKENILRIKELIARGDTYQINYTSKCHFDFAGNIFAFYRELKANQQVSYSALINYNGNYIISLSPELFFRIDKNQKITVKPMKGTAPIGTSPGWLQADSKNISENVMIVDLLRNDLGRICKPGTVKVQELYAVEKYATLLQMTSTVTGKLCADVQIFDIIKSLFPCGSVTGAPKIQSMKIIHDLEKKPRDIYTGAIGFLSPDGQAVFNVAIRTIDLQLQTNNKYHASMGMGGGIVFDSQPEEEYSECLLKAQFLKNSIPEFALIETMHVGNGKIKYLDMHLRRLEASAQYFGIPCVKAAIKKELLRYAKPLTGKIRLRLLLKSSGEIVLEHRPLIAARGAMPNIAVSGFKTQSDDPFLYHKTTHRSLYDEEYKKYTAQGYFDIIFRNEKDEVTEGAISNIFIRENNRYFTPPLTCGLLSGIKRQMMIKRLKAQEKVLFLSDLKKADKILLTNSVRGINEVIF